MVDCVYNLLACQLNFIECVNKILCISIVPKDAQCSETDFLVHEFFFTIVSYRDMVDFVFDFCCELGRFKNYRVISDTR